MFHGHLLYFVANFGIFFPALVCCVKKNLATLEWTEILGNILSIPRLLVNVKVQFFIASEPEMGLTELRKS
jgi:hypothetical protein